MRTLRDDAPGRLLVIVGPTASGKSELALRLARETGGEVIAADSRTVYRGLDLGTAKPEGEPFAGGRVVEGIKHHLLDVAEPDQEYALADFLSSARAVIANLHGLGKLPIVVGGTGLYVRSLLRGFELPEANPPVRRELEALPDADLLRRLQAADPDASEQLDLSNRHRVERALEAILSEQQPLQSLRRKQAPDWDVLQLAIHRPRSELYARIEQRVDQMMAAGLAEEVAALVARYGEQATALNAIGYRQWLQHRQGELTAEQAVEQIKRDTRHYAKRQLTWWRQNPALLWGATAHLAEWARRWLARPSPVR